MTSSPSSVFHSGGGAMGARIRAFDWASTELGPLQDWSAPLRIAVDSMMGSNFPGCIFWGPNLIAIYNDGYAPMLGNKPDALGMPLRVTWQEAWPDLQPIALKALAGESTFIEDFALQINRHGFDELAYFTFCYSPLYDAEGLILGMLDTVVETTSKVVADRHARAERERQQRLLEKMPGFVAVLTGQEHVFSYVNEAYIRIAGARHFLGRPVRDVFPELEGQGYYEMLDSVFSTGEALRVSATPISLAGEAESRFIDLLYEPIRNDAGDITGIFVGGYDASEQVRAKAALEIANSNLEAGIAQALSERQAMEAALVQAQKMEAVGQLTGGIAHDFNNLLGSISGSLQLMKTRLDQRRFDELERYMSMTEDSVRRASTLTQRLLAFSRRQTLDPKPLDANLLVSGLEDLIRRSVGPAVSLEVSLAAELGLVKVDASQLENTLLNLCINARDAMPHGGRLVISTARRRLEDAAATRSELLPGDYLQLSVADSGTGMPPEIIRRIFDPFFTTKPIGQGTGLGLSMVYGFVRQSGGNVSVESRPGRGTGMHIFLPAFDGVVEQDGLQAIAGATEQGEGETVLVIEDEWTIRLVISEVLEDAGYKVLTADNGPSGLRVLQGAGRVDLLVTDVGLPNGMNGRQVADAARVTRPGLKVLFITGYVDNAAVGNGHLEKGMEVLTKPFDVAVLAQRVRGMIDSAG
ncbi:MAG: response regulator [Comamonadaceae bacterium]|nr:MAG: response regulator [Comamonadaceae bacterium]